MRVWKRIRQFWRRRQFEAELAEEIRFHREMAGAAFGSEALALEDSRAVWSWGWLDALRRDVHYAARGFRKTPGFALTVVGTIGLGLGLNTTLFTVFNAYVLRAVAVRDPNALYQMTCMRKQAWRDLTWPEFESLRQGQTVFSDVVAYQDLVSQMDGRGFFGQLVTGNYFDAVGAGIAMGRPLTKEDCASPGAEAVMVLSYTAWQSHFGGEPDILGKKIYLRGQPFEIVGVTSPGFGGLESMPLQFWAPITMYHAMNGGADLFGAAHPAAIRVVGRMKPQQTVKAAEAALLAWAQSQPVGDSAHKVTRVELDSKATMIPLTPSLIAFFSPVFVGFALVLAISCANVANMMLARALARQREMGIRVSLGAGRGQLVRQLLTESMLLALPAAAAGFLISESTVQLGTRLMFATLPAEMSRLITVTDLSPDARVFGFILMASLGATLLFGLIPAVQTTRSSLVQANRGDFANDYRPSRLRNALVVAQVTVCALLLICAVVVLHIPSAESMAANAVDHRGVFEVRLIDKSRAKAMEMLVNDPSVECVALARLSPVWGLPGMSVRPADGDALFNAAYNFVSPEYFSLFRIGLAKGRLFSAEEAASESAVVVIDQSAARRFWGDQEAIGKTLVIPHGRTSPLHRAPDYSSARVIGVVHDSAGTAPLVAHPASVYFPTSGWSDPNEELLVRVKVDAAAGRRALDAALNRIGPNLADFVFSEDEVAAMTAYPYRVAFWIASFLAGLALVLTASGIYGVMSYLVSQRTKEIGIRMALGADTWSVVGMVMRQSLWMAAVGTAAGAVLAMAATQLAAHTLFGVNPYDMGAYGCGILLVLVMGCGAAFFPSRRAVRVDPVDALRCD